MAHVFYRDTGACLALDHDGLDWQISAYPVKIEPWTTVYLWESTAICLQDKDRDFTIGAVFESRRDAIYSTFEVIAPRQLPC